MRGTVAALLVLLVFGLTAGAVLTPARHPPLQTRNAPASIAFHFPPPGQSLSQQDRRFPADVGLDPAVVGDLWSKAGRWALWRHGRLVALRGNFNLTEDVKSVRKTWHAVTVGAALQQGRIPSLGQKIVTWDASLTGKDRQATWWHVVTQSAGFDYPYGGRPDYSPGLMWTYSELHIRSLTKALAHAYGKIDQYDNYAEVLKAAYFDAIGMRGWAVNYSHRSTSPRLSLDLEDMGRLGLLMAAGGRWNGRRLIPFSFIEELETKQTYGMNVNYDGPNDGNVNLSKADFPEAPYGYLTWVNTGRDVYPDAASDWAWAAGSSGFYVLWNRSNGIVFAAFDLAKDEFTGPGPPIRGGVPAIIERHIRGPDPIAEMPR